MIFDSLLLCAVAEELQRTLVGGKVERLSQPAPLEIVVRVFHAGTKYDLLLSCEAETPRVHLTQIRRENPPAPPPFCGLLRKYLDGAWIESISLPLGFAERVLQIAFRATDGEPLSLRAEIMGKHSNVILVNDAGMILGAAKHISRALSRFREVVPGARYLPPPRQRGKVDLLAFPNATVETLPETGREAEWLQATFAGISPLLAREIVCRAAAPLSAPTLQSALLEALTCVRTHDYAPRLWTDDTGATQGAYPIPLLSVPPAAQHARTSISDALDQAAASVIRRDTFEHSRDALQTALRKARRDREWEQEEIKRGLESAARAEEYQQTGELLLASQHLTARGQTEVSVPDFYAPTADAARTIALDPTLGPRENAERWLKKARKARDSTASLEARQTRSQAELALLVVAETEAGNARDAAQIAAIRERVAGLLARGGPPERDDGKPGKPAPPRFDGHKIRTFFSVDGWEILVGENATSNDYLTTKVAAGSDIWLHVRAATSAHGVIRVQNRPAAVSPATLRQAAELVAARSEVKHSSLIPVDYTLKKYVRKPRKSAPGAVTYQNEKTVYVSGIDG